MRTAVQEVITLITDQYIVPFLTPKFIVACTADELVFTTRIIEIVKTTVKYVIARSAPKLVTVVLPIKRVITFASSKPVVACICTLEAAPVNDVIIIAANEMI